MTSWMMTMPTTSKQTQTFYDASGQLSWTAFGFANLASNET